MVLATALALQAGSVTLSWDYNFAESPDVTRFKVYCAPGTNVTWAVNNTNATKTAIMDYTGTGSVSNIIYMVGGLSTGPWTFTVTAMTPLGIESDNATTQGGTNVWTNVRPGKPAVLKFTTQVP